MIYHGYPNAFRVLSSLSAFFFTMPQQISHPVLKDVSVTDKVPRNLGYPHFILHNSKKISIFMNATEVHVVYKFSLVPHFFLGPQPIAYQINGPPNRKKINPLMTLSEIPNIFTPA